MKNTFWRRPAWRILRGPFGVILILYTSLVIYRIPAAIEQQKTQATVAEIHAEKLTLADAMGTDVPIPPTAAETNSTIAGVDANHNGIRDDVELAIFKLHPPSLTIRAAELQYALELQNELTKVDNSQTLVAAIQEADRGFSCLNDNAYRTEVEQLEFNTPLRQQTREALFQKYMTSFALPPVLSCDITFSSS